MNSNHPIYSIIHRPKPSKNHTLKKKVYYREGIDIWSPQLCSDMAKYGIVNCKSLILQFPTNLPKPLVRHFIRGYFDGDGTVGVYDGQLKFRITSSPMFANSLQDILIGELGLSKTKLNEEGQARSLSYSGNRQVSKILDYLYAGATIYLARKKDKSRLPGNISAKDRYD